MSSSSHNSVHAESLTRRSAEFPAPSDSQTRLARARARRTHVAVLDAVVEVDRRGQVSTRALTRRGQRRPRQRDAAARLGELALGEHESEEVCKSEEGVRELHTGNG